MTQNEADKELGRIVRESLTKVIDKPQECEIDVMVDLPELLRECRLRVRVCHANDYR